MRALVLHQFRLFPVGAATALLDALFRAALAVAGPWAVGLVVARLPAVLAGGGVGPVATEFALLLGVIVVGVLLGVLTETVYQDLSLRTERDMFQRLTALALGPVRIEHLETPAFLDRLERVRSRVWQIDQGFLAGCQAVAGVLLLVGSTVSVGVLVGWLPALVLAAGAVGASVLDAVLARRDLSVWSETTEPARHAEYAASLVGPRAAKEIRVFGLSGFVARRYHQLSTAALLPVWRRRRELASWQTLVTLVRVGAAVAVTAAVVRDVVAGRVPLSSGATAVPLLLQLAAVEIIGGDAAARGAGVLRDLVATERTWAGRSGSAAAAAAGPTTAGSAARCRPRSPSPPAAREARGTEIALQGVRLDYPCADGGHRTVLHELDLVLRAGETTGMVGVNGAGKSTLVRVLTGALRPTAGHVVVSRPGAAPLDLADAEDTELANWQRQIAVLTQDFARYPVSLAGNVAAVTGTLGTPADLTAVAAAVARSGADAVLADCEHGWDQLLDPAFRGGRSLSGGQWQRVALARVALAVERGARCVVLDEPAAALDTRAEDFLVRRHLQLTAGVTSLVVSHRFSVLRPLPHIVVLEGGRVVEDGGHDDLVAADGRYARMFRLQASRLAGDGR